MSILEIKAAIDALTPLQYCELMGLLHPFEDDDWDRQMKADAAAGKLDKRNAEAEADFRAGRCIPLDDLIADES